MDTQQYKLYIQEDWVGGLSLSIVWDPTAENSSQLDNQPAWCYKQYCIDQKSRWGGDNLL
jgi:hypothetical protein